FYLHGQSLHCGVQTRPLGDRPALERIPHLQAKIVMAMTGMMKLHHKQRAIPLNLAVLRLRSMFEPAFALIIGQTHVCPFESVERIRLPFSCCPHFFGTGKPKTPTFCSQSWRRNGFGWPPWWFFWSPWLSFLPMPFSHPCLQSTRS